MLHKIKSYIIKSVKVSSSLKIAILVLSFIGMMDASYLTYSHFSFQPIACLADSAASEAVNSCQMVADSDYSTVLGLPISAIGLCFYLTVFTIAALSFKQKHTYLLNLLLPLAGLAALFSLRLIYLQAYVIGYFCNYCLVSAMISFVLFGISIQIYQTLEQV